MLESLPDKTTRDIYDGVNSRQARKLPRKLHDKARRLLDQINAAPTLDMLRIPPSNRLEKLKGVILPTNDGHAVKRRVEPQTLPG